MKRVFTGLVIAFAIFTASSAQTPDTRPRPGDRPAANIHSTRSAVFGRNGMIATSQPLASAAALKVLMDGGNAIDAAVTAAAVLAVVEPSMTGIGGDLFAIVYDAKTKTLHVLNASGRSAYAATPAEYARRRETRMPAVLISVGAVRQISDMQREITLRVRDALEAWAGKPLGEPACTPDHA